MEAAVRWLASRIELPAAPPADRPASSFAAFLLLLAAREETAALDGWGEPGAADAAFETFFAALRAEPAMEAARAELDLFAMTATATGVASPEAASRALERVIGDFPGHWPSFAALGQVRAIAGDPSGAADAFERAVELMPGRASLRFDLGIALLRAGRTGKASKTLETVRSDPRVGPAALFELGRLREQKGDPEGSFELLKEAAALAPDLPDLWATLGRAHVGRGEFAAAEDAFRRGLSAGAPSPALRRAYGVWLAEEGRFPEAVEQLTELLKLSADEPLAHLHLGRADLAAGKREPARHHLRKALRAGGEVAEAARKVLADFFPVEREEQLLSALAKALLRPAEEQVPFLEALISEESAFVEARVWLGIALVARGKPRAAEKHFRRAQKIAPADPEVLSGLATALRARGKLKAADEAHVEALRLAPNHAPFHLNRADTLLRQNRAREAAREVDAARALDPRHPLLPNFVAAVKAFLTTGGDR
jgi:tetratricopeptide (TPR) repeat protein